MDIYQPLSINMPCFPVVFEDTLFLYVRCTIGSPFTFEDNRDTGVPDKLKIGVVLITEYK